jgi:hypothetical protein
MSDNGPNNTVKMWIIACAAVLVVAAVLLLLQWRVPGRILYDQSDAALYCVHDDQCERPGDGKFLAERQNTMSNLAYLLFGICVIVRAGRYGAPMRARPGALLFGASLCFLAICSGYYHATLNFDGTRTASGALRAFIENNELRCNAAPRHSDVPQLLDIVGVYAALIALFLYGIEGVLKKDIGNAGFGAKCAGASFGVGVPLIAVIFFSFSHGGGNSQGGALAGLLLAVLLAIPTGFTITRYVESVSDTARGWIMWAMWVVTVLVTFAVSYFIKPDLHWDSTYVFAVMMALLIAILGVNWSFSANPIPWPEIFVLGVVFMVGIGLRMLDGYDTEGSQPIVVRKDLCSPNAFFQAHALWHVMSALALILTFDMVEKSRPVCDASPGTVLFPQDGELSRMLGEPTATQPPSAIVVKIVVSTASLLFFIVIVANHERSVIGWVTAGLAASLSTLLWLWPLFSKR